MESSPSAFTTDIIKISTPSVTVVHNIPKEVFSFGMIIPIVILMVPIVSFLANFQQVCQMMFSLYKSLKEWWVNKLPSQKVLGSISENDKKLLVFVRDLYLPPKTLLLSRDGINGKFGYVPNINELWPRVEGIGLSRILNALGQNDKTKQIEIIEMGKDIGLWDSNLIILGAQAQKCLDFYKNMINVSYEMDAFNIINKKTRKIIPRVSGYGYGIILKCKNPYIKDAEGYGFLIGGYGVLGTEAAAYYFANNLALLGNLFGKNCFGIIVRASITAGAQSVERIHKYDIKFNN